MSPKGRPPFSSDVIRYALLLRYTSPAVYKMLLQKFPVPSFALLKELQKGGLDSLRAVEILLQKDAISSDVVVIADEMDLQKCAEFHGGEIIGANENGYLFKDIVVFMIAGLA